MSTRIESMSSKPNGTPLAPRPEKCLILLPQRERIPIRVYPHSSQANMAVAAQIADLIRSGPPRDATACWAWRPAARPSASTTNWSGCTAKRASRLRTSITFNLDEYYPMQPNELQSYVRFMREHLFDHIDIPPGKRHIPDGTLPIEQVHDFCTRYEEQIVEAGGIDMQNPGHRPHRAHRVQRARLGQGEPHAADHARPRDADRRGQRLLR